MARDVVLDVLEEMRIRELAQPRERSCSDSGAGSQGSHPSETAYRKPETGFKNPVNPVNPVSTDRAANPPLRLEPPTDDPDAAATWAAAATWVLAQLKAATAPISLIQLGRSCPVYDGDYPLPLVVRDLVSSGLVVGTKHGLALTDRGRAVVCEKNGDHQQTLADML